jgi:hypothetical protein
VLLAGCAGSARTTMRVKPEGPVSALRTLDVRTQSNVAQAEEERAGLHRRVRETLQRSPRWEPRESGGDASLTITIIELTRVTRGARIAVGAMAGQASVEADVVMTDARGAVVARFHVKGKSSGGSVFAGTTDDALDNAAREIGSILDGL